MRGVLLDGKYWLRNIWRHQLGQDLVEYALVVGFVAVSAGATMPTVAGSIGTVASKVASVMTVASGASPAAAAPPTSAPPSGSGHQERH